MCTCVQYCPSQSSAARFVVEGFNLKPITYAFQLAQHYDEQLRSMLPVAVWIVS